MGIYNKFGVKYMFNEIVMVPNLHFLNVIISIIFVSGRISIIKEISIIKDRIS